MSRTVKLDLRGSPPVSGGMRDHIPPGRYRAQVVKMDDTTSKSGKHMWAGAYKVSAGEYAGSNLGDNFVLVDNNNQPSKMGLGRLHHFLLCLQLPVKEAAFQLDLDNLTGLEFECEVADEQFESNGTSRTTSAIRAYFKTGNANGNGTVAAPAAAEEVAATIPEPEATEPEPEAVAAVEEQVEDLFR